MLLSVVGDIWVCWKISQLKTAFKNKYIYIVSNPILHYLKVAKRVDLKSSHIKKIFCNYLLWHHF